MPVSPADVDRLFLQAALSRGIFSKQLALVLWEKCTQAVNGTYASNNALNIRFSKDENSWNEFISRINKSLDKLDLEFRTLHDEITGRELYGLVNRKGDDIAQVATDYTPTEIAFFKAIIEQIVLAPREAFSVSSLAALREPNAAKISMTKSQAEVVLESFVSKGWLLKSKRGRYSLSARSILELQPYLKTTYPDEIIECTVCMEVLTRGVACYTPNCKTRLHFHCFTTYRRRHQACPSCNHEWPREAGNEPLIPVGEDAARDGDDRKRRDKSERTPDNESSSEDDVQASQSTPPKRGVRFQSTKRPPPRDEIMEVEDDEPSDRQPSQIQNAQRRKSTKR